MKPVLEVKDLSQDFGGLRALNELSLTVNRGEIVALIGPNGAGKTTFFNCVTGIYTPTEGQMYLHPAEGEKQLLNGKKPHLITAMGMARTFQNIRLFSEMTVLENVALGAHLRSNVGVVSAALHTDRREEAELLYEAARQLERVGLGDYLYEQAGNLALGQQRILEIARALSADPVSRARHGAGCFGLSCPC